MPKQPPAQDEADKLINRIHAQIVALSEGRKKYLEEPEDPVEMFADDIFFAYTKAPVKKSISKKSAKKSLVKKPAPQRGLLLLTPTRFKNVKDKKELAQRADALLQWMAL